MQRNSAEVLADNEAAHRTDLLGRVNRAFPCTCGFVCGRSDERMWKVSALCTRCRSRNLNGNRVWWTPASIMQGNCADRIRVHCAEGLGSQGCSHVTGKCGVCGLRDQPTLAC